MNHLGFYNTTGTRTRVRILYSTHDKDGANVAPSSAIDAADIRVYRANDSAAFSDTQRSSAAGITSTSPFDSLTGFHGIDIDLTDNTDSGFYASGYLYAVVLAPSDETIDSEVITGVMLGYFEIGTPSVAVASIANDAITSSALAASAATEIADATLSRDLDQVEASAPLHSLATAGLRQVSRVEFDDVNNELTVYQTDGTTAKFVQSTTQGSISPITEVGIATAP